MTPQRRPICTQFILRHWSLTQLSASIPFSASQMLHRRGAAWSPHQERQLQSITPTQRRKEPAREPCNLTRSPEEFSQVLSRLNIWVQRNPLSASFFKPTIWAWKLLNAHVWLEHPCPTPPHPGSIPSPGSWLQLPAVANRGRHWWNQDPDWVPSVASAAPTSSSCCGHLGSDWLFDSVFLHPLHPHLSQKIIKKKKKPQKLQRKILDSKLFQASWLPYFLQCSVTQAFTEILTRSKGYSSTACWRQEQEHTAPSSGLVTMT